MTGEAEQRLQTRIGNSGREIPYSSSKWDRLVTRGFLKVETWTDFRRVNREARQGLAVQNTCLMVL
jgi:hypothetical protein